jgi:hypothetical protein
MYGLQSGENKDGFKWTFVAGFGVEEEVMDDFYPISVSIAHFIFILTFAVR